MLQNLQHAHRPLTTAELLPGLWVEQVIETKSQTGNYSNPGLLASDRREPARLVLWVVKPGGLVRSYFILGPGDVRDDSFPVHEVWPIDPDYFTAESRELLIAYAERSVYNPERSEFEINP
ncbi:hypothetical protein [Streptomyces phytophilus]|uniref:hypothetical protein n=1 Tax=Streptomyces phytophilus TaxID=722715 RepID=UPI0015EFE785|nr:hypothetical protein [Streptomyces phytophilus]